MFFRKKEKKFKPIYIFVIILAVLAIAYIILMNANKKQQEAAITPGAFLAKFSSDAITKLDINPPNAKKAILEKINGTWVVADQNNYPADEETIKNIFDSMSKAKFSEIVSSNPDNYSKFDLTPDKAIAVKMYDANGTELYNLLIGKAGPSFFDGYAKKANDPNVYLLVNNLNMVFNQSDWVRKTILPLNATDIKELTIYQKGKPTYRFERQAAAKEGEKGKIVLAFPASNESFDQNKMEQFFTNIAQLKTKGIIQNTEKELSDYGLLPETILNFKINIVMTDGTEHEYRAGKEENAAYYLQVDDNPIIFNPANGDVERFEVKLSNLIIQPTK